MPSLPAAVCLVAALLLALRGFTASPVPPEKFQKGITFTSWETRRFALDSAVMSLKRLKATGANWVAISITGTQLTCDAQDISQGVPRTPFDSDVRRLIAAAHRLKLRVLFRPVIAVTADPGRWHGEIGKDFTTEDAWASWFAAYEEFIIHYARLAAKTKVELFCIGAELEGTTGREKDWRRIVAAVRHKYRGPLVYAANWSGELERIGWWDAVDFIGVNAYHPLSGSATPTVEELKTAWNERGYVAALTALAEKYNKPIILMEIGYRSVDRAALSPWDFEANGPVNLTAQANAYQAALETFYHRPWIAGIYWWAWDLNPEGGGANDTGYTPQGKPAEWILEQFYLGLR